MYALAFYEQTSFLKTLSTSLSLISAYCTMRLIRISFLHLHTRMLSRPLLDEFARPLGTWQHILSACDQGKQDHEDFLWLSDLMTIIVFLRLATKQSRQMKPSSRIALKDWCTSIDSGGANQLPMDWVFVWQST